MGRNRRVMIIDESAESRDSIEAMLRGQPLAVVADSGYGIEASMMAKDIKLELVLAALEDPLDDAVQTIRTVSELLPNSQLVVYSGLDYDDVISEVTEIGVTSVLPRPFEEADLMAAIESPAAPDSAPASGNGSAPASDEAGTASEMEAVAEPPVDAGEVEDAPEAAPADHGDTVEAPPVAAGRTKRAKSGAKSATVASGRRAAAPTAGASTKHVDHIQQARDNLRAERETALAAIKEFECHIADLESADALLDALLGRGATAAPTTHPEISGWFDTIAQARESLRADRDQAMAWIEELNGNIADLEAASLSLDALITRKVDA